MLKFFSILVLCILVKGQDGPSYTDEHVTEVYDPPGYNPEPTPEYRPTRRLSPYGSAPTPAPASYGPTPAPYGPPPTPGYRPAPTPASYGSTPAPYGSTPAPYGSTPAPYGSTPAPYGSTPAPAPYGSAPSDYQPPAYNPVSYGAQETVAAYAPSQPVYGGPVVDSYGGNPTYATADSYGANPTYATADGYGAILPGYGAESGYGASSGYGVPAVVNVGYGAGYKSSGPVIVNTNKVPVYGGHSWAGVYQGYDVNAPKSPYGVLVSGNLYPTYVYKNVGYGRNAGNFGAGAVAGSYAVGDGAAYGITSSYGGNVVFSDYGVQSPSYGGIVSDYGAEPSSYGGYPPVNGGNVLVPAYGNPPTY